MIPYSIVSATFFAAFLASGVGTGGGALYMPGYIIAKHGNTRSAVPLSKATILGVACASFLYNMNLRKRKENIIQFSVAALLEPPTLLGTIIGINLNSLLPPLLIIQGLILCLSYTGYKTFRKAQELYIKEKRASTFDEEDMSIITVENSTNTQMRNDIEANALNDMHVSNDITNDDIKNQPINKCSSYHSLRSQCLNDPDNKLSLLSVPLLATRRSSPFIEIPYSTIYLTSSCLIHWLTLYAIGGPTAFLCDLGLGKKLILSALIIFHSVCIISYIIYYCKSLNASNQHARSIFSSQSQFSSAKHLAVYSCGGVLAGIGAGALGIGGGLIKGPLMLQMGLEPLQAVSTATYMLLFTSSSTTLSFALNGQLDRYEGFIYGMTAFFGSLLGLRIIRHLVRKSKSQSLISFALALVIFLSMISLVGYALYETNVGQGFVSSESTSCPSL